MDRLFRLRIWLASLLWASLLASRALGFSVTAVTPADYQVAALTEGSACYIDAAGAIASIPLALAGGTLIRTEAADGPNPALVVSFAVDVRAEVYVCYDSRTSAPPWLSSWVDTDMTVGVSGGAVSGYRVYARRFDAGLENHQHFKCVRCKRIVDFHYEPFDEIELPPAIAGKFTVLRKTVYLEGICDLCK